MPKALSFNLRPATRADWPAIRRMIYRARINPLGLDWRRFIVAVDSSGDILGCGQIKPHADGSSELASIAVQPNVQGRGIGSAIVRHLMQPGSPRPLYLTCRPPLIPYYQRFGFRLAAPDEMPPYFRRLWRVARFFRPPADTTPIGIMLLD